MREKILFKRSTGYISTYWPTRFIIYIGTYYLIPISPSFGIVVHGDVQSNLNAV
jgi:hypothetical protein